MALPSQTERSSSSSRVSASRSRGFSSRTVGTIAALIVVAGGVFGIIYLKNQPITNPANSNAGVPTPAGDPKNSAKTPPVSGAMPPTGASPAKNPATPPPPAEKPPAPVTLNQGTNRSSPPATGTGAPPAPAGGDPSRPDPNKPADSGKSDSGKPSPVDVSNPAAAPGPKTPEATDTRPPAPSSTLPASGSTEDVRKLISQGDDAKQKGQLVQARQLYSRALLSTSAAPADQAALRDKLSAINDDLLFSPKVTAGDPLTETYAIQSGDAIARLPRKRELAIDWRLLKRINKMSEEDLTRLKVGQKIKLVHGPFHAVVNKADFRLDIFAGSPDDTQNWLYIRSFKVGLGEGNATPVGEFIIKSRQVNPPWTNPKTGEKFAADDPKNPIGEYWLGWEGVGPSAAYKGFGIHGTVDPDSIGKQKSMGCVRLLNEDVATVYEMLTERISVVQVRP